MYYVITYGNLTICSNVLVERSRCSFTELLFGNIFHMKLKWDCSAKLNVTGVSIIVFWQKRLSAMFVQIGCFHRAAAMWIQVRTMDGKETHRVDNLSKLTKVDELRLKIMELFKVEPERQRLFYRGKQVRWCGLNSSFFFWSGLTKV